MKHQFPAPGHLWYLPVPVLLAGCGAPADDETALALAKAALPRPRKVVLIAGAPDGHGRGTHEYAKDMLLFKQCLDTSPNLKGVLAEVHLNGWPEEEAALDDADAIVFSTTGSNKGKHPILKGERLEKLGALVRKGVGLVCIHYTLYVPNARGGPEFLQWIGGYNDYYESQLVPSDALRV
ncbi:MAG: hypothetical protein ACYTKD_12760 [Planctomycetota bacterium]|jgi:hypothetical protein